MESLDSIYKGKKVLITGSFGFKGSWLCYWLTQLNANVCGYSLIPETPHHHFQLLQTGTNSVVANINDADKLKEYIDREKPEIVFHLAAQPLVRYSYHNPVETYQTNIMGTVNVLEACRFQPSVKTIVVITSDKCYENRETGEAYAETNPMGGYDPYSSSKGCAELVVAAYRNSYFNPGKYGQSHYCLLATARAGNVIGGGDWSVDRLLPDIVQAASQKKQVVIRKPDAVRPWQHVLEPLYGYLLLGKKLLEGKIEFASGWNFGPKQNEVMTVQQVLDIACSIWKDIDYRIEKNDALHEAKLLMLDCSKANTVLNWQPVWDTKTAILHTINWYRDFYLDNKISTSSDLEAYINRQSYIV